MNDAAIFNRYVQRPENQAHLTSTEFAAAVREWHERTAEGEAFTTEQAADLLDVPIPVYRHLWISFVTGLAAMRRQKELH